MDESTKKETGARKLNILPTFEYKQSIYVMTSQLSYWGNSLAIRIPKHITEAMDMTDKTKLTMEVVDNTLVIKRKEDEEITLDYLLEDLSDSGLDQEWIDDEPLGKEKYWEHE